MLNKIQIRTTRLLPLLGILLFPSIKVIAQDSSATKIQKNTFFIEAFGNSGFYSLNYDRILVKKKIGITARFGMSFLPPAYANNHLFILPIELCMLYSGKLVNHFAEFSFASTLISEIRNEDFTSKNIKNIMGIRFGYRYQKPNGGLFAKVGVIVTFLDAQKNVPFTGGIGLGWTLKIRGRK